MNKIKWIFITLFLLLFLRSATAGVAHDNCQEENPCNYSDLNQQISCLEANREACRRQRDTLSSEIAYMNSQIRLTTLRIEATQSKISALTSEINDLENEVEKLESILTRRLTLLSRRVPESYKRAVIPQFGLLLFSKNFSDFITRVKYLMSVQEEDAALVFQVKATQNNYNERKQTREEKKNQLKDVQTELERQNARLASQKQEKNALLTATQGNEAKFQELLEHAIEQLAAIREFVTGAGGASILNNQTVCDGWGCYYNQRDSQWAGYTLGSSSYTVAESGCLITSVAMIASHYKKDIKPSDLASNPALFFGSTGYLYQGTISVKGVSITRWAGASIDSQLAAGNPVIVGVYRGPGHFIVLKSGSNGHYVMNDPFWPNGHDIDFSSHYSVSDITEIDTINVN